MPRKEGDMFSFKTDIAEKYGIKAAVVAQFIWESINECKCQHKNVKKFQSKNACLF